VNCSRKELCLSYVVLFSLTALAWSRSPETATANGRAGVASDGAAAHTRQDTVAAFVLTQSLHAASNPVPFIGQPLSPTSARPRSKALELTIDGVGFVSGSVVQWNGQSLAGGPHLRRAKYSC
jgi:hypothetical protein